MLEYKNFVEHVLEDGESIPKSKFLVTPMLPPSSASGTAPKSLAYPCFPTLSKLFLLYLVMRRITEKKE